MSTHVSARTAEPLAPRPSRVDRGLRLTLAGVVLAAVAVLAYGTVRAVDAAPPIPDRAVSTSGELVYSHQDVVGGKAVFQRAGLMDFGSLYGNGAYFGPDWGTDYLHRQAAILDDLAAQRVGLGSFDAAGPQQRQAIRDAVNADLRTNRFSDGRLTLTADQASAHARLVTEYTTLFRAGDADLGLAPNTVSDPEQARQLTAFFSWVAWTSVATRPGEHYSYTNNWPYEPGVGNVPTGSLWLWTWLSLAIAVLVAFGVLVVNRRLVAGHTAHAPDVPPLPDQVPLTPSQRATGKWFLLVPALLVAQGLVGSVLAHYFADRRSFFGLDLTGLLPYQVGHAWHIQLAIAWVAAAWLAAGLFLGPLVGRREPRRQKLLANLLWAAVVVVVVGSLIGIYAGVKSSGAGRAWWWFGDQGLEYLQLGRAFQIALFVGLLIWAALLARAFWPALRARRWGSVEGLLLTSGVGIGVVYVFGMLPVSEPLQSATMTDYWRWWVVHLWVEGMFEFFTVAVIGYAVLSMGLLSRTFVERTVLLELILVFGSGIIGTGHHFYWVGDPAVWLSLGAMFGLFEVIPLLVMMVRAWREYRAVHAAGQRFPQRTAFAFFTSAAVWNLLGAGLLGGILNPPIVNYYEHGQFLTLAHAHASMFGTFGLLALGLMYLALRGVTVADWWSDRRPAWVLRAFNAAIVLWLVLNVLPIGIAQYVTAARDGYWQARSLDFYDHWTVVQWLRIVGDAAFLAGGGLMLIDVIDKLRHRRRATIPDGGSLPEPATTAPPG